jgi:cardiolipin synthase
MALVGCLLCGASDVLDGYLAKHHNMSTVLGTYLDPLADKILINVLSLSLWYNGTLPTALVGLWLAKDVGLSVGAYSYVSRNTAQGKPVMDPLTTPLKVNPTVTSKVNTGLQFATLSLGILLPTYPGVENGLMGLCWLTGLTTIASGFSYLGYSAFTESGNPRAPSDRQERRR